MEECVKEWRLMFKRKKSVFCPKCGTHKGNSVGALKYHWEKCGKVGVCVSLSHDVMMT